MSAKSATTAGVTTVKEWWGDARQAGAGELEQFVQVLSHAGIAVDPDVPTVVFCYPGLGVGERACELSGCTNQLILLGRSRRELARLGIRVLGASGESPAKHAHLEDLADDIAQVQAADVLRLPHTLLDGEPYLLRRTLVLAGPRRGLVVDAISDSVAHTRTVLDVLVQDRLAGWWSLLGREARTVLGVDEVLPNGAESAGIVTFGTPPVVAKVGPRAVVEAEVAFVRRVDGLLTTATQQLGIHLGHLSPSSGSLTHGDPHLRNLLRRPDGNACLVDPRTVWDGQDQGEPGYGDPAYDYATLLHSLLPMSAVLRALDTGTTARLLQAEPPVPGPVLDLRGLCMPPDAVAAGEWWEAEFAARLARSPHPRPPSTALAQLRVGAANALAGWLKHPCSLSTPHAWLAVLGWTVWYLSRAQEALQAPTASGVVTS